jgi:hypothetical protein
MWLYFSGYLLSFLVCEGDWSAYGVRDFIGEYVTFGLLEFPYLKYIAETSIPQLYRRRNSSL